MYLDYWQLDSRPFEPGGNAAFVHRSPSFEAAMRKLRYAVDNRKAAAVLAGPAGIGKTLLVDRLRDELGEQSAAFARLVFPQMTERDLLVYLAEQLGAPPADPPRHTVEESLRRLEFILRQNAAGNRHTVIAVDEAHLLEDTGLLETLRLLLNICLEGRPAFTLLLVGQTPVTSMVQRHGALDERIDIKVLMPPLTQEETAAYIAHRLHAAGATREIFDPNALTAAHSLCSGIPRRVNRLCDLALLVGYANGQHTITDADLHAVHEQLIDVSFAAAA